VLRSGKRGLVRLVGKAQDERALRGPVRGHAGDLGGNDDFPRQHLLSARPVGQDVHRPHRLHVFCTAERLVGRRVTVGQAVPHLVVRGAQRAMHRVPALVAERDKLVHAAQRAAV